jgi:hypothetical protein
MAGWLAFDSLQGQEIFLYPTVSRPALGPTEPLIKWVSGVISPGAKWSRHKAGHSPTSSAMDKNAGAITPLLHTLHGVVLN